VKQGWAVVGIEPSPEAADAARAQGVEVLTGSTAGVALSPNSFDAVIFQQSLEHTEEPVADLERAFQALVPGGIVAVGVPNFGGRQSRVFRSAWFHLDVPRHRTHFTPRGLGMALESAGFTDVAISTSTSAIGFPGSVQYRVVGRCLFPSGLPLRIAAGLSALALPLARLLDAGRLQGDILSATARRPSL
jgi:SAM-dependent methyltransferase